MPNGVLSRKDKSVGVGLRAVLEAQTGGVVAKQIPSPPEDAETVKATCDTFTFDSFTAADAWELGHLLYARLLPFAQPTNNNPNHSTPQPKPTVISIASAHGEHVLFQTVVGTGTAPDNDVWVRRKRAAVLRFGTSTWFLHCKFRGDEEGFRRKVGLSDGAAAELAIHGGGVPVRVAGVEGIVAVVVVSGLAQDQDHGVIVDVINNNWE